MNEIFVWIKDIFLMILSVTFLQILIPDSNMSKYIRFIFSLIILDVSIEPVIRYIS